MKSSILMIASLCLAACGTQSEREFWEKQFQNITDLGSAETETVSSSPDKVESDESTAEPSVTVPIYKIDPTMMRLNQFTGMIAAHRRNSRDPITARSFGLAVENSLSSADVSILTGDGSPLAAGTNGEFAFTPGTSAFDQANLFVHATDAIAWFEEIGFDRRSPIEIFAHKSFGNDPNNAIYRPESSGSFAQILIGKGDDKILKNLSTDADVVTHEIAHHFMLPHINSLTGEGMYLELGLAQSLVMLKNDDACFAPTICPENSTSCSLVNQCMFTGETTAVYEQGGFRQRSHAIAGFVWDLRKHVSNNPQRIASLIAYAVRAMQDPISIDQFVDRYIAADTNDGGQNADKIRELARARHLPID